MSQSLVSIVINNYNYAKYLPDALEIALRQTYPNVEVIVVDDGSSDESQQILAEYAGKIKSVVMPRDASSSTLSPAIRQAAAIHAGFQISQGAVVFFLDADDLILENTVEAVMQAWQPDASKAQFYLEMVNEAGQPQGTTIPATMPSDPLAELLRTGVYPSPPTSGNAWARGFLEKVLPMPTSGLRVGVVIDVYLTMLAPLFGRVLCLPQTLGLYRIHGNNLWSSTSLDANRLRKYLLSDIEREGLFHNWLERLGRPERPTNQLFVAHLRTRMALLRLEPNLHPFPTDTVVNLGIQGIKASWSDPQLSLLKRLAYTGYFTVMMVAPTSLAKTIVLWATSPTSRPQWLKQIAKG